MPASRLGVALNHLGVMYCDASHPLIIRLGSALSIVRANTVVVYSKYRETPPMDKFNVPAANIFSTHFYSQLNDLVLDSIHPYSDSVS